jgi:phosphate transport system protein
MSDKHISSQFDTELNSISTHVLEMGGLVEAQLHQAIYALVHLSLETAEQVLEKEAVINQMEMSIDHEIISTIGRRQPTARDLRFLMAISRTTQNLERAGDEIARIARMVRSIIQSYPAQNCAWHPTWRLPCCARHLTRLLGLTPPWQWPSSSRTMKSMTNTTVFCAS